MFSLPLYSRPSLERRERRNETHRVVCNVPLVKSLAHTTSHQCEISTRLNGRPTLTSLSIFPILPPISVKYHRLSRLARLLLTPFPSLASIQFISPTALSAHTTSTQDLPAVPTSHPPPSHMSHVAFHGNPRNRILTHFPSTARVRHQLPLTFSHHHPCPPTAESPSDTQLIYRVPRASAPTPRS